MGTRGSYGVRIDGQDKLTYNHFDSYYEGLGTYLTKQIADMLKEDGLEKMKKKARALTLVDEDEPLSEVLKKKLKPFQNKSVGDGGGEDAYAYMRELQGKLQEQLNLGVALDYPHFILDSLFCEYAYILNLDEEVFEVYEGFQRKRHDKGRYANEEPRASSSTVYYPCALMKTFPLDGNLVKDFDEWAEKKNAEEEGDEE